MKLLITSDVHGHLERLEEVIKKHKDVDYHINAGDMCLDDFLIEPCHLITVKGNNDFYSTAPYQRVLNLDGLKILLTHGHIEGVRFRLGRLKKEAKHNSVDLVIFGHTHIKYFKKDQDMIILNPGALGDFHKSYAIYENGQVTFYEL